MGKLSAGSALEPPAPLQWWPHSVLRCTSVSSTATQANTVLQCGAATACGCPPCRVVKQYTVCCSQIDASSSTYNKLKGSEGPGTAGLLVPTAFTCQWEPAGNLPCNQPPQQQLFQLGLAGSYKPAATPSGGSGCWERWQQLFGSPLTPAGAAAAASWRLAFRLLWSPPGWWGQSLGLF